MSSHAVASFARIVVLVVLVFAAVRGGSDLVATSPTGEMLPPQRAIMVYPRTNPGEIAQVDLATAVTLTPTEMPTPLPAQPTAALIQEPTQVAAPVGRGVFPVPENTTGRSIIIERGPEDRVAVALSFDAGETSGYTSEILDMLKAHGIHASFGVTGEWARANPDLVNRILDDGHIVFNHSESHRSWTGESPGTEPLTIEERTAEVMGADQAVEDIADWNMRPFWRPPYGDLDAEGQGLLENIGYDYTFWWTCDTLAWMETTSAEIAERCNPAGDFGGPGAIILMHVEQENDYGALEQIITEYDAAGYEFVTLNEMIGN